MTNFLIPDTDGFFFVGCWLDLDMIKYSTCLLLLTHTLANDIGFPIDQDKRKLILTTQNTNKLEKLIYNYFKDLKVSYRTSKTKIRIEVYPFLGTPVDLASLILKKTNISSQMVLKGKNWTIVILVSFTKLAQIITILKKTMMENVGDIFSMKKSQKSLKIK